MTLSTDLQRIYASAPVGVTWYDALWLDHPLWASPVTFITNTIEDRTFNLFGGPVLFNAAVFSVVLPRRDDLGLVDFEVTFPLTAQIVNLVDLAEPDDRPIQAVLTTYIDSQIDPQMEPIELQIDSVGMGVSTGVARAQRIDLLNRAFPRNVARPRFFPGLWRG